MIDARQRLRLPSGASKHLLFAPPSSNKPELREPVAIAGEPPHPPGISPPQP